MDAAAAPSDFIEALTDDDPEELYEHAPCAYVSTLRRAFPCR
jgi:hypothetical protein